MLAAPGGDRRGPSPSRSPGPLPGPEPPRGRGNGALGPRALPPDAQPVHDRRSRLPDRLLGRRRRSGACWPRPPPWASARDRDQRGPSASTRATSSTSTERCTWATHFCRAQRRRSRTIRAAEPVRRLPDQQAARAAGRLRREADPPGHPGRAGGRRLVDRRPAPATSASTRRGPASTPVSEPIVAELLRDDGFELTDDPARDRCRRRLVRPDLRLRQAAHGLPGRPPRGPDRGHQSGPVLPDARMAASPTAPRCSRQSKRPVAAAPRQSWASRRSTCRAPSLARLGLPPADTILVGDRLLTDVRMAREAGMISALVLSGATSEDDLAASDIQPDFVVRRRWGSRTGGQRDRRRPDS